MKKLSIIFSLIIFLFLFSLEACSSNESTSTGYSSTRFVDDQSIGRAVITELLIAPNIFPDSIRVSVTNGVVTLSGKTDNILTRRRAAKIAESVTGVLSVVNNIMVTRTIHDDAEINDDIITALANNPATDAFQVNVEVNNGNVILSGTVKSWQEKELCRKVAESVKGVLDVKNNIKINYNAVRTDNDIKADIKSRLKWDIYVNQQFINVSVKDGNVSLSGSVASAAEKEWAYDDSWVNGVLSVNDNDLKIQWWENSLPEASQQNIILKDKEIQSALEQIFIQDPEVQSERINIKVNNGIVTLRGTLSDLQSKIYAEKDARRTLGVSDVVNDLKVQPAPVTDDLVLKENASKAIARNPYLNKFKIEVSVGNGEVYLTGNVDNKFDKSTAEEVASSINGITGVQNDITYREPQVEVKSDKEIKGNIKSQLYWNPITSGQKIKVDVTNGAVLLSGFVATDLEKTEATFEAYQGGASEVDNELEVTSGPKIVSK